MYNLFKNNTYKVIIFCYKKLILNKNKHIFKNEHIYSGTVAWL